MWPNGKLVLHVVDVEVNSKNASFINENVATNYLMAS